MTRRGGQQVEAPLRARSGGRDYHRRDGRRLYESTYGARQRRNLYAFMLDEEPQRVGFIRNGNKGCSPDALIGDSGMLEIKTQLPALLIETLLGDKIPPEHVAQIQGGLLVAEREWIDLGIYWPKMPFFCKRAYRDEKYISALSSAIDGFNEESAQAVEAIRRRL
jgi:hypothetical protein